MYDWPIAVVLPPLTPFNMYDWPIAAVLLPLTPALLAD
jgi:hypothetical protein